MSETDPEIQQGLCQARDALRLKIEKLNSQLARIEEVLAENSCEPAEIGPGSPIIPKLPPLEAARSFFADYPEQEFHAADLCDYFIRLRKQGRLRSNAKNLQIAANDALRKLTDQGKILRIKDGRRVMFKVAE